MHLKVSGLSDRFTNRPKMLSKHEQYWNGSNAMQWQQCSNAAMQNGSNAKSGMGERTRSCLKYSVQLYATKFNTILLTSLHRSYFYGVKIQVGSHYSLL